MRGLFKEIQNLAFIKRSCGMILVRERLRRFRLITTDGQLSVYVFLEIDSQITMGLGARLINLAYGVRDTLRCDEEFSEKNETA